MLKYVFISALVFFVGCAPYVNAGNKNMVTVQVPNRYYESEDLALADAHCAKYGKSANLRKPRNQSDIGLGALYDYTCVK